MPVGDVRLDNYGRYYFDYIDERAGSYEYRYLDRRVGHIDVVDLGAGTGCFRPHDMDMLRVELSDVACRRLQAKGMRYRRCLAEHTRESSESAGSVVACHLLNMVECPEDVVSEAYRILRPGGKFHVIVPWYWYQPVWSVRNWLLRRTYIPDPCVQRVLTMSEMTELVESAGFRREWWNRDFIWRKGYIYGVFTR
jgi:ubiquinone/menaquinone biosynthesis C-methylase UbiE